MCPQARRKSSGQPASIVRLCIDGYPYADDLEPTNIDDARTLLAQSLRKPWPSANRKAEFTVLPGGFIVGSFPRDFLSDTGWKSPVNIEELTGIADRLIQRVLTHDLIAELAIRTKYVTMGVDLKRIGDQKTGNRTIKNKSIELVAVVKLTNRKARVVLWTGKSYPTSAQENSLVHVVDLDSHCFEANGLRTLVLGCHDLNMFSARAWANQRERSRRRLRCQAMRQTAKKFKPNIVIQHAHQTDTPNIWRTAWSGLKTVLPTVKQGLTSIAYYPAYHHGDVERKDLPTVLDHTKFGPSIEDVVIKGFR